MVGLLKDWVVDPVGLLFLLSLIILVSCFYRSWRCKSGRAAGECDIEQPKGQPSENKELVRIAIAGTIWITSFLICTAPVIVNPLLLTLEDQYPPSKMCPAGSHVVVLGGGVDSRAAAPDEFERMSPATLARASTGVRLLNDEPETVLIAAGGVLRGVSETTVMSAYWQVLGIDERRIIEDDRSSNTRENAMNVREVLQGESVTGVVRLVTSALHMPRALSSFRKALTGSGIDVCPVSTDAHGLKMLPRFAFMPQTTALIKFDLWLHEVVALLMYKVKDWV